jgi:hypothetical protein
MPMQNKRIKAENEAFVGARVCRMSQLLPGNRHDARMWAQLGPLSHRQYEKPAPRNSMKLQPSGDT